MVSLKRLSNLLAVTKRPYINSSVNGHILLGPRLREGIEHAAPKADASEFIYG